MGFDVILEEFLVFPKPVVQMLRFAQNGRCTAHFTPGREQFQGIEKRAAFFALVAAGVLVAAYGARSLHVTVR